MMPPLLLHRLFAAALFLSFALPVYAHGGEACAPKRKKKFPERSAVATAEELYYDVKHVTFNLNMTNTGTAISGNVATTATVTAMQMPVYAFELDTALTIDSVKINGLRATVSTTGKNIRKVILTQPISAGQSFTAQVWYHGEPTSGTGFFSGGLNHFNLSSGQQITYTLGDMYYASEWWPCKQDIRDKIDSVDMTLTVPAGTMGCSNGTVQSTTTLPDGRRVFAWKHRYPVKYYLITAAVAPYQLYSSTVNFNDGTSMPVHNYLYDVSRLSTSIRNGLDSLPSAIHLYSGYFGKYPFWTEKYGNCQAPLAGGMEHQTMTTLGEQLPLSMAVHELAHQWWGDCVSQKTWQDIWLSEGFATYCEELFLERYNTLAYMTTYRRTIHNQVRTQAGGSVYVSDTTNENRVFDNRLTYAKGSVVAGMLRYQAPADSLFFVACRQYINTYRFGNATTEDLKNVFERVYNQPLDTFFNQWIYGEGFPSYRVNWNYRNGMIYVKLVQTTSMPLVTPLFHTPVDLEFVTATGTALHKVYNNQASQVFALPVADSVLNVRLDPYERILNGQVGAVARDSTLAVRLPFLKTIQLNPNPTEDYWTIEGLMAGVPMQLLSVEGKAVWKGISTQNNNRIAAHHLSAGTYILQIDGRYAGKLIRK